MNIAYSGQSAPTATRSIFLAGPTPRDTQTPSWRPEALRILQELGFEGTVFVPEHEDGNWPTDDASYAAQCEWEHWALQAANCIVFWIPRNLKTMPAFTTNVEFGLFCRSGRVTLGYPEGAPKMRYLRWLAGVRDIPVHHTLRETLQDAMFG